MNFLVDTNVISEVTKPSPNSRVLAWLDAALFPSTYASVITLGELRTGIEDLAPGRRRVELESWLEQGLPAGLQSTCYR